MTEEEAKQAIVDAALALSPRFAFGALADAVAAYRRATTPEPFEALADLIEGSWSLDVPTDKDGNPSEQTYGKSGPFKDAQVWRVQITPIERVR